MDPKDPDSLICNSMEKIMDAQHRLGQTELLLKVGHPIMLNLDATLRNLMDLQTCLREIRTRATPAK
jgi:hypothetical protein